jgi:hypothetical protein
MPPTLAAPTNATIHAVMLVTLIQQILWIVLFSYFLYYFQYLKAIQCKCAIGWRNSVLQAVLIGMILMFVLRMYLRGQRVVLLSIIQFAMIITFIIVSRQFLNKTRNMNCECAYVRAFRVLDIVNIIMIFLLVLALLSSLFIFLVVRA